MGKQSLVFSFKRASEKFDMGVIDNIPLHDTLAPAPNCSIALVVDFVLNCPIT
jgi:hypothetical protein